MDERTQNGGRKNGTRSTWVSCKLQNLFALLCFSSLPVSLPIPALRGLSQKRQTKRQSNGFSRKYRTFYVNVLQGGNTLVRCVKYLSVGAKNLSVGAKNLSVALPFCCLFFQGIFKKRLGLFSGGLIIMLYVCSGREDTERRTEKRNSEHLGKLQATKLVCAALLFFSTR